MDGVDDHAWESYQNGDDHDDWKNSSSNCFVATVIVIPQNFRRIKEISMEKKALKTAAIGHD